jgi:ATP-dependent phosphoenolpyruvate carboxykinase
MSREPCRAFPSSLSKHPIFPRKREHSIPGAEIVTNMFIRPSSEKQIENIEPEFTVINCCSQVDKDWKHHGLNSEVTVAFNVEEKTAVIFGTYLKQLLKRSNGYDHCVY